MLLRRSLEGLVLLAWLAVQYLLIVQLQRFARQGARAWRRWLDGHGSRLFLAHVHRHGGLLIKIGQFVASRPDVFPLTYVDACSSLRDQLPARSFATVKTVLDLAYEGRTSDHLPHIEEQAIAAASFGQVHRAWLADGRLVAVKIQYPELEFTVAADLRIVALAARLFAYALPGWPIDQVYQEIVRTSRDEQDYLHEGAAADRLREGLSKRGLSVPEVLWPHTREKVLVMEFADGVTLAQLDLEGLGAEERRRIADTIIEGFLYMLLDVGFFHADPHAGNLIYDRSPKGPARLWLIDYGMTASISHQESELYRRFLDCVRRHDTDGMVDVLADLGWVLPNADRAHLRVLAREVYDGLAHLDPQTFKGSRRERELGVKVAEFLRRMTGIVFPRHTVLLSRATSLIEGNCMALVPGKNLLDLVRPHLTRITSVRARLRWLARELQETWRLYRGLPERLDAALSRQPTVPLTPIMAALLLIAALLLPAGTPQTIVALAAGAGVLLSLGGLRR
jgi:predicted unusual protein kinase regulating ubiquinone biosynthesis (AarF/ABC1/UbiB family)